MAEKTKSPEKEKSQSFLDKYREYSNVDISIKPYFNPDIPNMGLEKYGQVFFEGTGMLQSLRSTEINGVVRYRTNLDEFSLDLKRLPESERLARIKMIRETVAKLDYEIFANKVSPDDEDFWGKVNLKPTNENFWSGIQIAVGNQGMFLDPNNPKDLLIIIAAEGWGFDDVAPSLEEAVNMIKPPKFYLEKKRDVRIQDGKLKLSRDRAIAELYKLRMEEPQKLFWLAKNILPIANSYKPSDKIDILYGELNDYIEGASIERNKKLAPVKFMEWLKKDAEYLTIRAYVLDAIFLKYLVTKADNKIYVRDTGSLLGGNIEECIEHLRQAVNQRDLEFIEDKIKSTWNK